MESNYQAVTTKRLQGIELLSFWNAGTAMNIGCQLFPSQARLELTKIEQSDLAETAS